MGSALQQTDQRLDAIMGRLLRAGVALAALIVFVGGAVYLNRHHLPVTNYHVFQSEPPELRTISGILSESLALRGRGLIQLGVLILIATPIARVTFSVFAFLYQGDRKFVLFTLMVLGLLLFSLLGGRG